jgi:hypothetical protein
MFSSMLFLRVVSSSRFRFLTSSFLPWNSDLVHDKTGFKKVRDCSYFLHLILEGDELYKVLVPQLILPPLELRPGAR